MKAQSERDWNINDYNNTRTIKSAHNQLNWEWIVAGLETVINTRVIQKLGHVLSRLNISVRSHAIPFSVILLSSFSTLLWLQLLSILNILSLI